MELLKKIFFFSKKKPNFIAIKSKKDLTYSELWNKSCNLAHYIKKKKIKKICILQDSYEENFHYVAMLASLISGATYIPINKFTPLKRIKSIINLSKSDLLISYNKKIKNLNCEKLNFKDFSKIKLKKNIKIYNSQNDAYIIFTSGSTGIPKGVRISRKAMDHYINWITKYFFNDKIIRCSQHPGIGFDLSVADIYGTLSSGGTLYPLQNDFDRYFISKFIKKNYLTHFVSVPSVVDIMMNENFKKQNEMKSLKKMFFCGEILKKIHLDKIFKSNSSIKVINSYGPTEATVSCTALILNNKNYKRFCKPTASFGKSIQGMKINFFKNQDKKRGELIILGPQVSEGYLNKDLDNKKKFFKYKKKKSFLTGDICKEINGNYYFVNRIDRQTKIYGYRVELNEIDILISDLIGKNSHSIVNDNKIYTFIIGKLKKIDLINKKLNLSLPKYMLPYKFIEVKTFPKNNNQKIDEKKLLSLI